MSIPNRSSSRLAAAARATAMIIGLAGALAVAAAPGVGAAAPRRSVVQPTGLASNRGAIGLRLTPADSGTLVELTLPPTAASPATASEAARRMALRVLAVGPDGTAAVADAVGGPSAGLTIVHPDGSQARAELAGPSGAAFHPDGGFLAVVDATGRLWRVDAHDGRTAVLASGPYAGRLAFTRDGSLLLAAASSAEAPYASTLVRYDPRSGHSTPLWSADGFVFSARELDDGSVAAVVHPFGSGIAVLRIGGDGVRTVAALPSTAVDVTLSGDGAMLAYSLVGDGVRLLDRSSGRTTRLGPGDLPRIGPDGSEVLVLRGGASVLLGADGRQRGRFASAAVAWVPCGGGCRP